MLNWTLDLPDRRTMAARHGSDSYIAVRCPGGWKGQTNAGGKVRDLYDSGRPYRTRKAAMAACERHANPPPRPVIVFTAMERKVWRHKETGRRVSPHGALPWWNARERDQWEMIADGFTIRCDSPNHGTIYWSPRRLGTMVEAEAVASALRAQQIWPIPA